MLNNIYVLLELQGQTLSEPSAEILGELSRIAKDSAITAILPQASGDQLTDLPVHTVYYGGPGFPLLAGAWAKAAAALAAADLVIAPMSVNGRDFAASYAAEKGITYIPAVCGLEITANAILVKRLSYGGLAQEEATLPTPLVLGLSPGLWGLAATKTGEPALKQLPLPQEDHQTKIAIERLYTADWQEMELEEGGMVVSGGLGMGNKENFQKLYDLGAVLQAPVGGSRVAEDKGWIERRQMIGATGQTIAPELYIACGISGAVQHTIGVQGSRYIVAINTDATAAMMSSADLAVNCDAGETVKELSAILKDYAPAKEG